MSLRDRVAPGTALFFALLVVAIVTAVLVVRARTPDLVLEVVNPRGPTFLSEEELRISFFVREADGHARVAIVDSREDVVRTLDQDVALAAEEKVRYVWDRSTDAGAQAPLGRYRLLVELPSEDRVMIWPRRITLLPLIGGSG